MFRTLLCVLALSTCLTSQSSAGTPENGTAAPVEAFGDSMTAGLLSDYGMGKPISLPLLGTILSNLVQVILAGNNDSIAQYERHELAWPTQLALLRPELFGANRNFAVSGAHVPDLMPQLDQAGDAEGVAAFFLIGHNDLCANYADPSAIGDFFAAWMRETLRAWDRKHRDSTAYVLPIADIHRAFQTMAGHVWMDGPTKKFACEDSWNRLFPYCPTHARMQREGILEPYMMPRLAAVKSAFARVTAEMQASSGGSNRFLYLDGALDAPFKPEHFAVDCYHASAMGQAEIAKHVSEAIDRKAQGQTLTQF